MGDTAFLSALITGCHLLKNGHREYQQFIYRVTEKLKNV